MSIYQVCCVKFNLVYVGINYIYESVYLYYELQIYKYKWEISISSHI